MATRESGGDEGRAAREQVRARGKLVMDGLIDAILRSSPRDPFDATRNSHDGAQKRGRNHAESRGECVGENGETCTQGGYQEIASRVSGIDVRDFEGLLKDLDSLVQTPIEPDVELEEVERLTQVLEGSIPHLRKIFAQFSETCSKELLPWAIDCANEPIGLGPVASELFADIDRLIQAGNRVKWLSDVVKQETQGGQDGQAEERDRILLELDRDVKLFGM